MMWSCIRASASAQVPLAPAPQRTRSDAGRAGRAGRHHQPRPTSSNDVRDRPVTANARHSEALWMNSTEGAVVWGGQHATERACSLKGCCDDLSRSNRARLVRHGVSSLPTTSDRDTTARCQTKAKKHILKARSDVLCSSSGAGAVMSANQRIVSA